MPLPHPPDESASWPEPLIWVRPPPPKPRRSFWHAYGRNIGLFLVTSLSVYGAGALDSGSSAEGLGMLLALMAILLAHEMGHYLACRYYAIDATLPFFIPSPWLPVGWGLWQCLLPSGTLGAVIRIRSPFPHRRALFDVGFAGPLAGFIVCLPVLILSLTRAHAAPLPSSTSPDELFLNQPLLSIWLTNLLKVSIPEGQTLVINRVGLAAWFGLLLTGLNLIPIGQFDGGHVLYALLGRKAHRLARWIWWACVAMIYFSPSWILWAILARALGRSHPPTLDDAAPLGRARVFISALALVIFVLCFMPEPIAASWPMFLGALRDLWGWLLSLFGHP
jgi:membrane-associated protease RseP (regulator of RpoE activity)